MLEGLTGEMEVTTRYKQSLKSFQARVNLEILLDLDPD